jgi:hypothetical protein
MRKEKFNTNYTLKDTCMSKLTVHSCLVHDNNEVIEIEDRVCRERFNLLQMKMNKITLQN